MQPNIGASHAHNNTNIGAQSGGKNGRTRTFDRRICAVWRRNDHDPFPQVASDANLLNLNELIAEAVRTKMPISAA
jgi:hypothetical protein